MKTEPELADECACLITALAECRDAFPIPPKGSTLDQSWRAAMGDPESIPGYVKACLAATPAAPTLTDVQIDQLAADVCKVMPRPGHFVLTVPMLRQIIDAAFAKPTPLPGTS